MTERVALHLRQGWESAGGTTTRGHAFVDGIPAEGTELAHAMAAERLEDAIISADGGFAAVQRRDDAVVAGVDRLRTIPLFYAQAQGRLYLSDDAYWIAEQLPAEPFDDITSAEFLAVGYITGRDTLHPRIKQLQAGEILSLSLSGPIELTTERYFTYHHGPYYEDDAEAVLDSWDASIQRIMERLVRSARGRRIVVPLSGGLDSRLLLLELRRLGYDKVQTFTYGVAGNNEIRIAELVAKQLGYPWTPVLYTRARWRTWCRSQQFTDYVRYADGLSTVVHVQDWPAVWELRLAGEVPDDAIFVPGHNGGFLFGENGNLHRMSNPTVEDLVRNLERVHYHNWPLRDDRLRLLVRQRLAGSLQQVDVDGPESGTSAWEQWEWQERQAKFMCNSVRAYEFWGYHWRMPFWDREAIEFWERVPIHLRARARLHRAYVARASARAGLEVPGSDGLRSIHSALMRDYVPERAKMAARRVRGLLADRVYRDHPMAWFGIVTPQQFRKLYSGSETINSILALHRLGLLPSSDGGEG